MKEPRIGKASETNEGGARRDRSDAGRGPAEPRPPADPWQGWKGFAVLLLGGIAVVFAWQLVDLVRSLRVLEHGAERGMIWAVLLMVAALFVAVVGIGGGLLLASRRSRSAARKDG